MSRRSKRRQRRDARTAVKRGVATGGTVTLASLGLTSCTDGGGGAVDPSPPPPAVCADVDQGQGLRAFGALQDSILTVNLFSSSARIDTVYVSNVTGAALDSLSGDGPFRLDFTLDSDTTSQVTFTIAGRFDLVAGPCDFARVFTATIDNGNVEVAERRLKLPLGAGRETRIELVEREGLRIRLKAVVKTGDLATWRVDGGAFEPRDSAEIVWHLPAEPGFYQVQLCVDRGEDGVGFDALSFEVS